jgi:transcriptional regulator with XRE-family HTH domain
MNQCPAKRRAEISIGESVRIVRELQGFSQNELSQLSGIAQATLCAIENDRVRLGVERAKVQAGALRRHPAVLVVPGWELPAETAALLAAWARFLVNLPRHDDSSRPDGRSQVRSPA